MKKSSEAHGDFRYLLTLESKSTLQHKTVTVILKNPSIADVNVDDNTLRSVRNRLVEKGYNKIHLVNLFAYRSTEPKDLNDALKKKGYEYVVGGLRANEIIIESIQQSDLVLLAWGKPNGIQKMSYDNRIKEIQTLLKGYATYCYGSPPQDSYPKHGLRWQIEENIEPYFYN